MIYLFLLLASQPLVAEEVDVKFLPSGVTKRVGGYRPVRAEMDQEASIARKIPEDFAAPKFGQIKFGDKQWVFVVDEPEEGEQRLLVDSNQDGDLTNDPQPVWKVDPNGMYKGEAEIDLGAGQLGKINLYRFDPKDKRREQLKNTVLYYSDFGYEFAFELDGQKLSSFVAESLAADAVLPIDRDQNGQISRRYEVVKIGEPFNFTGSTYLFSLKQGKLALESAAETIPQAPMPPDLRLGKQALSFVAKTMDGAEVEFPKSFAGKIVMLDCWATWCGPCIAEIPNMKQAYADWHEKGFEILGVSFDDEGKEEDVRKFLSDKELPWPQIFEGKGWDTAIGIQHDVSGIPFVLLVDGDSGEILGTSRQLRGEKLTEFIGLQLEKKGAESKK
jgi:thiol-disulfide isomerase/thioredoxin